MVEQAEWRSWVELFRKVGKTMRQKEEGKSKARGWLSYGSRGELGRRCVCKRIS